MPWIIKGLDRETGEPREVIYYLGELDRPVVETRSANDGVVIEKIDFVASWDFETPEGPPRLMWGSGGWKSYLVVFVAIAGCASLAWGVLLAADGNDYYGDAVRVVPKGLTPIYALGLVLAGLQILTIVGLMLMTGAIRKVGFQLLKQLQRED